MKPTRSGFWRDIAHLTLAYALAVAQPLFGLLGAQPQFLVAQGITGGLLIVFALLLTLAVPAALALALWPLQRLSPRIYAVLLNGLIALLLALAILPLVARLNPGLALACAATLGVLLAAARARTAIGRQFATVFALAVPIFPAAFVWFSPARDLVTVRDATPPATVQVAANPVFVFVFDEFPVLSLMTPELEIDAGRYPNFARLAATSTWYRYATTVSEATVIAVPAALTGYFPTRDKLRLAVHRQYPRTLFTLLAPSHRVHARESGTQLCPPKVCAAPNDGTAADSTLANDLWIVYQHLVLPTRWRGHLPSIQQGWTGFGQPDLAAVEEVTDADQMHRQMDWNARLTRLRAFLAEIPALPGNTFHYYHALLPHAPWVLLPDARAFAYLEPEGVLGVRPLSDPGPLKHTWYPDPVATDLAQRRHLLQVGAVDTVVGEILDSIEASGRFDDALIVITGDHGAAFVPGTSRRAAAPENFAAVAGVPLFVKYPQQTQGRVVDAPARLSDLTPTVLDALGAPPLPDMDGIALPALAEGQRSQVRLVRDDNRVHEIDLVEYRALLAAFARRQAERYGNGGFDAVIRPELRHGGDWLGRRPADFQLDDAAGARVEVRNPGLYAGGAGNGFVPSYLRGTIAGLADLPHPGHVLIAVDDRLVTSAEPFASPGLTDQFATLLPPALVESGPTELGFYWQATAEPGRLVSLQDACPAPRLEAVAAGTSLASGCPAERTMVRTGAYHGQVRAAPREDGLITVSGWAGNTLNGQVPEEVLVFVDGALAARAAPEIERPDLVARYGVNDLARAGFMTFVSGGAAMGQQQLRVMALGPAGAAELNYPPAGQWPFAPPPAADPNPIPVNFTAAAHARLASGELDNAPEPGGYRLGRELDLSSPAADPLLLGDWYPPGGGTRWAGSRMALVFAAPSGAGDLSLEFRVRPFLASGQVDAQSLRVRVGAVAVHEVRIESKGAHSIRFPIAGGLVGDDGLLVVEMSAPDAAIPHQLGVSADLRELSFAFERARLSAR